LCSFHHLDKFNGLFGKGIFFGRDLKSTIPGVDLSKCFLTCRAAVSRYSPKNETSLSFRSEVAVSFSGKISEMFGAKLYYFTDQLRVLWPNLSNISPIRFP